MKLQLEVAQCIFNSYQFAAAEIFIITDFNEAVNENRLSEVNVPCERSETEAAVIWLVVANNLDYVINIRVFSKRICTSRRKFQ